jgi:hypothetical protein
MHHSDVASSSLTWPHISLQEAAYETFALKGHLYWYVIVTLPQLVYDLLKMQRKKCCNFEIDTTLQPCSPANTF